jgi:hypothetical protein
MQYLIDFAENDSEVRRILEITAKYKTVQGVVVDLDRSWVLTWTIAARWGEQVLSNWIPWLTEPPGLRLPRLLPRPIQSSDIETWRPPNWGQYQQKFGLKKDGPPWVVRVCLRPTISPDELVPTIEELRDSTGRVRVELETRSVARLASNPRKNYSPIQGGISIGVGPTDYGTLGLTLHDSAGKFYGLTCCHVAPKGAGVIQPAPRDGRGVLIGRSIVATTLISCAANVACNPWSGANGHELDLALIEIANPSIGTQLEVLDIGPLSGITRRAAMSTGQPVEVMGRTTEFSSLQLGGLAVWYRLGSGKDTICFKNLFEVESPYGHIPAIKSGDSGAAVCAAGASGKEWCGMIVGSDMYKGFALYAETAKAWLDKNAKVLHVF